MSALASARAGRILVVDDDRDNRELLGIILEAAGFLVVTAPGGKEALVMVAEQAPELLLIDVMMPGMDGYELASRLKGQVATRHIPFIMVSALDDLAARTRATEAGAEGLISKPIDSDVLCVRVADLVRRLPPARG